jgi:hypothetical protein
LVTKTRETRDPEEMGKIIEQFDKLALEDKGDLKKAKIRRDFLKIIDKVRYTLNKNISRCLLLVIVGCFKIK